MSWLRVLGGEREEGKLGEGEGEKAMGKLTLHSLHSPPFQRPPALALLPLATLRHLVGA